MTNETFLPHPLYPNTLVGTLGTILSTAVDPAGRVRRCFTKSDGYVKCGITLGPKVPTSKYVHRLVAETHVPNPLKLRDVNHINHNKGDNRAANLEWVTHQDNIKKAHAFLGNWVTGAKIRKPVIAYPIGGDAPVKWRSAREWAKQSGNVNRAANVCKALSMIGSVAYGYRWEYDTTSTHVSDTPSPATSQTTSLEGL